MAVEVPQNEKIFGGRRNGGKMGVGSAIHQRRGNTGSINFEERE